MARFLLISAVQDWLRCLAKEHSLNARVVLVALSLAGYGLFGTLANEWARPVAIQEATYGMSIEAPASLPRSICVAAASDCGAADGHAAREPPRHAPVMRPLHCQRSNHYGLSRRSRP